MVSINVMGGPFDGLYWEPATEGNTERIEPCPESSTDHRYFWHADVSRWLHESIWKRLADQRSKGI